MFFESLEYPAKDEEWLTKILIGGILSIFSFLIIPLIFVVGYYLEVMRFGLDNESRLPNFDSWGDLFSQGLSGIIIGVAYPLLSIPLFFLSSMNEGLQPVFLILGTIAFVGGFYLLPAGLANYVRTGKLTEAFDSDMVLAIGSDGEYIKSWLVALVISFIGSILGGALSFLLIGVFINFYVGISLSYLFGKSCSEVISAYQAATEKPNSPGSSPI